MQRLMPAPSSPIALADWYAAIDRPIELDRAWIEICMVASLDGTTVVDGKSGALGSRTDTKVLLALRRSADLILVGASTVRAEGYGAPSQPGLRVGVVTRNAAGLSPDMELFASGAGFLIAPRSLTNAGIETVHLGETNVDPILVAEHFAGLVVHCEGGATLNGALIAAGVVQSINLTVSPHLAAGDGSRVARGAESALQRMELAHLLEDDGFLFSRWVRRPATSGQAH